MYKALYRKYRPRNFDEVAGQDIVIRILKNSIKSHRLSHAYLFSGPRGTGKTSVAKIFAKTINCDNCINGIPCDKCSKCLEINNNEAVDIIEIDAASNNGVDEIRDLKSKVNFVPSLMKFKVYIIDEVHMLSIGAFNALLKTLEEPPAHIIFILATTELHKVPNTIISRCQMLEFRKIPDVDMANKLNEISTIEKINISNEAIGEIVKYSDGGLRDALGLLDKLFLYSDKQIDEDTVRLLCGNASIKDIEELLLYINNKQVNEMIIKIDDLYASGKDIIRVANEIMLLMGKQMICDKHNQSYNSSIIESMAEVIEKMKLSNNPKLLFEAFILNKISIENISREIFLSKNEELTETTIVKNIDIELQEKDDNKINISDKDFKRIRVNNTFVEADKNVLTKLKKQWNKLSDYTFDQEYGAIVCNLIDSVPVAAGNEYLILMFDYESLADKVNNNYVKIQDFLCKFTGNHYKVVGLSKEEWIINKEKFIEQKKKNNKYIHIEDIFDNDQDIIIPKKEESVTRVEELFGTENIVIK